MKKRFFITSTGTGIGKSFITAALVQQAKALKQSVVALKPIITGFNPEAMQDSDTALLLNCLSLPLTLQNIDQISPWRFMEPMAPSMAANREQKSIDFKALISYSQAALKASSDVILIEGIGGIMVPIDDQHTVLDWMAELECEIILVVGNYLGSLSHTLTALEVLEQRKLSPLSLIVNETENATISLEDTMTELKKWTKVKMIAVTRQSHQNKNCLIPGLETLVS